MMKMSPQGIRTLIDSEGSINTIYDDQAGLPTIGVGHLLKKSELSSGKIELSDGSIIDLRKGKISDRSVERLLADDLIPREKSVYNLVDVPLEQEQFDALVHFAFNVGIGAFRKSTLLKRVNAGNFDAVPAEIRKWNIVTIGGKKQVSQGLANRREIECQMWEEGCKPNSTSSKVRSKKKTTSKRKKTTRRSSKSKTQTSKPAHQSKIITLAVTTGVAYLGTKYGIDIPAQWQTEIESGIVVIGLGGIAVLRRWYTDQDLH
jgi:lysozyme